MENISIIFDKLMDNISAEFLNFALLNIGWGVGVWGGVAIVGVFRGLWGARGGFGVWESQFIAVLVFLWLTFCFLFCVVGGVVFAYLCAVVIHHW